MQSEIRLLINTSKNVIRDCSLKNGAIVAANSRKSYFPEQAKDYHYVWPRDASYTCVALDYLGETDLQERFFSWCSKAERFYDEGVFFEKYNTDGTLVTNNFRPERTTRWKSNFQPDQTGILLYAIWHHFKERVKDAKRHHKLIEKAANGICRHWDRTNFRIVTQDLWERKFAFPDMKDNFTYSLASCARGLECAYELLGNKEWLSVSRQMKNRLGKHYLSGCFVRSYGKVPDRAIDTSVLGMIFPFEILRPNDKRAVSLMRGIEKSNVRNYG
ncbi:hypothetical protein KA005_61250, partial [bacterium]|nr:hypothetical protein [bacterium]